jgi:hypothetical protein
LVRISPAYENLVALQQQHAKRTADNVRISTAFEQIGAAQRKLADLVRISPAYESVMAGQQTLADLVRTSPAYENLVALQQQHATWTADAVRIASTLEHVSASEQQATMMQGAEV